MKKSSAVAVLLLLSCACLAQVKNWKPFTSKVGAFTVDFLTDPEIKPGETQAPEGYMVKTMMHMSSSGENVAYVLYTEMEAGVNILEDSVYLANALENVLKRLNAKPTFVKDIMFEGFPGKHFLTKLQGGAAEGKIILRSNRAYMIAAFFQEDQAENRKKFLESFHFTAYQEPAWKSYTSKDYFFTVDFPVDKPKVDIEESDDGSKLYTFYGLDPQSGNNYCVAVDRYSPYAQFQSDTAVLDQRTTYTYGDNILEQKDLAISGKLARELTANIGSKYVKMKMRTFTSGNLGYSLFAFLPANGSEEKNVTRFFNSFKFTGKVPGNLTSDKTDLILKDVASNDTAVWHEALSSFELRDFEEKDAPKIQQLILKKYPDDTDTTLNRKAKFLSALGGLGLPSSVAFIRKTYPTFKGNSILEERALSVLASVGNKEANELMLEILKTHKPLRDESYKYYVLFARDRIDSLYRKEFLSKALAFLPTQEYKVGLYNLTQALLREKEISFADLQSKKSLIYADLDAATSKHFKDSTTMLLDDLLAISGYDQLGKKELDVVNRLFNSYNDYIRIYAAGALLRQNQKPNDKALAKLAEDHFNRLEMFNTFKQYDLLKFFPKAYLNQESIATSELYSFIADEYFEPKDLSLVLKDEAEYAGVKSQFYVFKFKDEEGTWYRGVAGPYDPKVISVWASVTGSDFEPWDQKDKDHKGYLKKYLSSMEE